MARDKTRRVHKTRQAYAILSVVLMAAFVSAAYVSYAASAHWLTVTVESSSLSPVVSTSGRYAASNLENSTVVALVNQGSAFYNVTSDSSSMTLGESIDGNNAYFVLTKGTVETIADKIPEVLSGAFETYINPTFAFPIIKKNRVTVGLDYSDKGINLTGDYKLSPGIYTLIVRNEGVQDGKTVVSIKRK